MQPTVHVLKINDRGSDGDSTKAPNGEGFVRNDAYWLERVATDYWAKDQGLAIGASIVYRLDKLPRGFRGFEKLRLTSSKHVDRYVYGHPNGVFRSLKEFYPHFKYLMDHSVSDGCPCNRCRPSDSSKRRSVPAAIVTDSNADHFGFHRPPQSKANKARLVQQKKVRASILDVPPTPRRRQVDLDQIPDVYRFYIDELELAGLEGLDQPIIERCSPDWRMGHQGLKSILAEWKTLPTYVPRQGEIVLFVRSLGDGQSLCWDSSAQTFRVVVDDESRKLWLKQPQWEAGVVTQMPMEHLSTDDLIAIPDDKKRGINESGFRIQPLARPNSIHKKEEKQHKYVPLHAIRPFALWKECVAGLEDQDWHPTIRHALTVANSFTLIGRYHFKGVWPEAAIFSRGVYIGHELILVGDFVRLTPRSGEQPLQAVADIMEVTSIKLIFVDLDEASDDDYDNGRPYGVCLHISGHKYTQDARRSFDGVGKFPITAETGPLPSGILELGQWYYCVDPESAANKTELPYQRVLGRCYERAAIDAWYTLPSGMRPPSSFSSVNATNPTIKAPTDFAHTTHGLDGVLFAREYSKTHDSRIDEGKTWFFADTRVEQLDLHEVNGTTVGTRDSDLIDDWRNALKVLDGNRRAVDAYHAARQEHKKGVDRSQAALAASRSGIVADAAKVLAISDEESGGATDTGEAMDTGEALDTGEAMDTNRDPSKSPLKHGQSDVEMAEPSHNESQPVRQRVVEVVNLEDESDDESDDELEAKQLAQEMIQSMRQ